MWISYNYGRCCFLGKKLPSPKNKSKTWAVISEFCFSKYRSLLKRNKLCILFFPQLTQYSQPDYSIAFEKALTHSAVKNWKCPILRFLKAWRMCCTLSRLASCTQGLLIEVYFAVCLVMLSALLWNHYNRSALEINL